MSSKDPCIKSASEPLDVMFHCLEKIIILTLFSGNASGRGLVGKRFRTSILLVSDASSPLPTPLLTLLFPLLWPSAKNHCLPFLSLYSLSPLPFTIKLLEKHSHRSPPGTPHQLQHSFQSPVLPRVLSRSAMASSSLKQWPGSPHPTWTYLSAFPLARSFC